MNSFRNYPRLRLILSRLGSLLLLLQRTPVVQMLFPQANFLGSASIANSVTLAITTVVGLGAFDSVVGATSVVQKLPVANSTTVNATVGVVMTNFVYGMNISDSVGSFQITAGNLPAGLTKSPTISNKTNYISGTPAAGTQGPYSITIKAWENSNKTGRSTTGTFTIVVAPPLAVAASIATHPASVPVTSGNTTTLSVTAAGTAPFTYQWYQGASGTTTTPVGTNSTSFTTPALTTTTSYWVKVTNAANPTGANSNAATVTVNYPATIAVQPAADPINSGSTATLTVTASGTPPYTYQWYQGVSGTTTTLVSTTASTSSTTSSFTTPGLATTTSYWVKVTNAANPTGANSNTATVTVRSPFETWASVLAVDQNGPLQTPENDGVNNLLKYAFNLDRTMADSRRLRFGAGDTAGLPAMAVVNGRLRLEYIRRAASTNPGISYTPACTTNGVDWTGVFTPVSVTPIGYGDWERVVVDGPAGETKCLGRVNVSLVP
jgi:hypothetical protein